MIGIIDYGMSNLYSVKNACDYLGLDSVVSKDVSILIQVCERASRVSQLPSRIIAKIKECSNNLLCTLLVYMP